MSVDRYLVTSDLVVQHEQGMWVRYEDHAAALTAERSLTDTANAAAVNAYAKVRELEALLAGAKAAVLAERAKFAAVNERLRKVLDRIAYGPFGGPEASASDLLGSITDFAREALTTKQAAEDAAGGKK
jgi:hypothetical protein